MTDYIESINGESIASSAFDGNKVDYLVPIFENITFTADQYRTYSLANIIPNDGFDYDVEFEGFVTTGTTSGNAAGMTLYGGTTTSDVTNICRMRCCRCVTRASSNQLAAGTVNVIIRGKDRNITVRNMDASGTSGNCSLYVKRHVRRVGFNQRSSNTNYISKISRGSNSEAIIGGKVLDGPWVRSLVTLASEITLNSNAVNSYSLSSYLPDDGFDYDVLAVLTGRTGTTSGNSITLRIGTESTATNNSAVARQVTRTKSNMICGGQRRVRIGANRMIYIANTGGAAASTVNFSLKGYRRLGTNNATKETNICIYSDNLIPCGIVHGTPTVNNGVMSNFSGNNYMDIPIRRNFNNAEYVIKFKSPSALPAESTNMPILTCNKILSVEMNGSLDVLSWNWTLGEATVLFTAALDTTYWVKIVLNNGVKTIYYSTNGETYTQGATISGDIDDSSEFPVRIGAHSDSGLLYDVSRAFSGSIDLNECYIKVNGIKIWQGMDYLRYLPIGGDVADGPWVIADRSVYSGVTFTKGSHSYEVSNYLPEDGCPYEVLVQHYGRTGSTSGNGCTLWVENTTDIFGNPPLSYIITRSSSNVMDSSSALLICTQNSGKITLNVNNTNSTTTGSCGLTLVAYRRIGNNI